MVRWSLRSIAFVAIAGAWTSAGVSALAAAPAATTQSAGDPERPAATRDEPDDGRVQRWWDMVPVMRGWESAKEPLSAKGLTLDIGYTHVWQGNARGGLDTHNGHRHTGSYDVILQLDTEKAGLWEGGLFNVWLEGAVGQGISETKVGDLMGVNADAQTAGDFQVSTAWYEHKFVDEKILLRLGKQDPAADFDTNRYANTEVTQFLNAALKNNPTIPWPEYSLGVQLGVIPNDWVYGQIGIFDAQGQGGRTGFDTAFHGASHFFLINEYGLTPTFTRGKKTYPGTYRVGYWYDPTPKELFVQPDPDRIRVRSGDWGVYVSFDQRVWKENEDEEDEQGLGLFFRYGFAHGDVNTISNFYSCGLQYAGLLPSRDEDTFGLGLAYASLSKVLGRVEPGMERETAIEAYYNIHINRWMQLSPDVQIIVDPGGDENLRNAIVVGLRFSAYF